MTQEIEEFVTLGQVLWLNFSLLEQLFCIANTLLVRMRKLASRRPDEVMVAAHGDGLKLRLVARWCMMAMPTTEYMRGGAWCRAFEGNGLDLEAFRIWCCFPLDPAPSFLHHGQE